MGKEGKDGTDLDGSKSELGRKRSKVFSKWGKVGRDGNKRGWDV